MGKTTDTLLADSKSDEITFLDRNAGKILFWSLAVSYALDLIGSLLSPSEEQLEDARKDEELFTQMVMLWALVWLIKLLAGLVSLIGKALAFIGYTQRGRDRERRRRAERARRQLHSSVHESQDATDR